MSDLVLKILDFSLSLLVSETFLTLDSVDSTGLVGSTDSIDPVDSAGADDPTGCVELSCLDSEETV